MGSPIDLNSSMIAEVHAPIDFRNYFNGHFNKHLKGSIINNGITVVWNVNPDHHFKLSGGKMWTWKNPSIRDGPFGGVTHTHAYYLWKIEFHWGEPGNDAKGSVHTIDGVMSPLEMQMVHVEDKFIGTMGEVDWKAAQGAQHGVAILSIIFQRQLPIAQVQANAFSSLYCNNYRPARPEAPEHELKYLIHDCLHCNCHCNV